MFANTHSPQHSHTTARHTFQKSSPTLDGPGESPFARARRLSSSLELRSFSVSTQKHIARVAKTPYPPQLAELLDRDHAPFKVCRWVAETRWVQDRVLRFAIVLLLRREARLDNPGRTATGWAWPKDHLFKAAERIFWTTPQVARLVKAGVVVERGEIPESGGLRFTTLWDQTWGTIEREFATIDRAAFLATVQAVVKQRKRRRMRKRLKLGEHELAYVSALDTIKRGMLRGDITLEDALGHQAPLPSKKAKRT